MGRDAPAVVVVVAAAAAATATCAAVTSRWFLTSSLPDPLTRSRYGRDFNLRAVLLDTRGPEIRTMGAPVPVDGSSEEGEHEDVALTAGQVIRFWADPADDAKIAGAGSRQNKPSSWTEPALGFGEQPTALASAATAAGEADENASSGGLSSSDGSGCVDVRVNYNLARTVGPGDVVLLDDGLIETRVLRVERAGGDSGGAVKGRRLARAGADTVYAEVVNSATLGSRKGVNLPGLNPELPAMTEQDKVDLDFAVQHDVDFIAASFVRQASDVRTIRAHVARCMARHWDPSHPPPRIISKIENAQGVRNFDAILEMSDGVMVARGDLGVEIPFEKVRARLSLWWTIPCC